MLYYQFWLPRQQPSTVVLPQQLATMKAVRLWPWRLEGPTNPLRPLKAPGDVRSDGEIVITLHTMHGNEALLTL